MKQDDELDKLEEDIRKLKNKYDQFFTGISKVPPMSDRRALEAYIHELSKQKIRENTRRFRFQTLLSRFNQYRELWARKMREREEGPLDFRRRKSMLEAAPPPSLPPAGPLARETPSRPESYVKVTAGTNGEEVRKLYDQIEREHFKLGKLPPVTFEQLAVMVEKQSQLVRDKYHVDAVAFRVETIDGKVRLKAKPLQD